MVSPKSLVFRSTIFSAVHRTIKLYEQGGVPQLPPWIQTFIILAQITNTKTLVPSYDVVLLLAESSFRFTLLHHRRLFEFIIHSHPSSSPYSPVLFPILQAILFLIRIVFTHLSSIPSRQPSFLTSTTRLHPFLSSLLSVSTITFCQPHSSRAFVYLTPLLRLPTHLPIILSSYYSQSHPSTSISTGTSQSFLQSPISSSRHPHFSYLQHYVYHTPSHWSATTSDFYFDVAGPVRRSSLREPSIPKTSPIVDRPLLYCATSQCQFGRRSIFFLFYHSV